MIKDSPFHPQLPTGDGARFGNTRISFSQTIIDFLSSPVAVRKKEAKWDKFASVWLSLVWYLLRMGFEKIEEEPEAHTAQKKRKRNKDMFEKKNPLRQVFFRSAGVVSSQI